MRSCCVFWRFLLLCKLPPNWGAPVFSLSLWDKCWSLLIVWLPIDRWDDASVAGNNFIIVLWCFLFPPRQTHTLYEWFAAKHTGCLLVFLLYPKSPRWFKTLYSCVVSSPSSTHSFPLVSWLLLSPLSSPDRRSSTAALALLSQAGLPLLQQGFGGYRGQAFIFGPKYSDKPNICISNFLIRQPERCLWFPRNNMAGTGFTDVQLTCRGLLTACLRKFSFYYSFHSWHYFQSLLIFFLITALMLCHTFPLLSLFIKASTHSCLYVYFCFCFKPVLWGQLQRAAWGKRFWL